MEEMKLTDSSTSKKRSPRVSRSREGDNRQLAHAAEVRDPSHWDYQRPFMVASELDLEG